MPRVRASNSKSAIILRFIVLISALAVLAGALMPMFTIRINVFGRSLYVQKTSLFALLRQRSGAIFNNANVPGLQNLENFRENIFSVLKLPVCLYIAVILLAVTVLISALINKLGRSMVFLSISATIFQAYLIYVMQKLPVKLIQSSAIGRRAAFIDWTSLFKVHIGSGMWVMLGGVIMMTISCMIYIATIKRHKMNQQASIDPFVESR